MHNDKDLVVFTVNVSQLCWDDYGIRLSHYHSDMWYAALIEEFRLDDEARPAKAAFLCVSCIQRQRQASRASL